MVSGRLFSVNYFKINNLIMIKKFKKIGWILILIFFSIFLTVNFCLAEGSGFIKDSDKTGIQNQTNATADTGGYVTGNVNALDVVQIGINAFLSIIGVMFLFYMLNAGYNWMTAQGDEEKVTKAKDTIKRAILGVIIIIGAYAISVFVIARLEAGTLKGGAPASTATPGSQAPQ
jgi:hypothetical protein